MKCVVVAVACMSLSCCTSLPEGTGQSRLDAGALHPFVGCWENEDGRFREGWTQDPSGWLIGYSAQRTAQNDVEFFEFMRVEIVPGKPDVLVVVDADDTGARFTRDESEAGIYRFVNAEHDYPQVITYTPKADRLDASISLLDGSQVYEFPKAACK